MLDMTIAAVAAAVHGELRAGSDARTVINRVVTDSRKADSDTLFVPLRGERFDGHDFLGTVAGKAAAVLCAHVDKCPADLNCIVVDDTLAALQRLANYHRRRFDLPVVAVTGSNGKTTTKEMIDAVLSQKYKVLKNEGNLNNEIGLPLTLLRMDATHQIAVVEMGMRGSGQITELCNIAEPTLGVVTNVGETHIELLKSIDNIASAKSELPLWLDGKSLLVLNSDDERVAGMAACSKAAVLRCGLKKPYDIGATNVRATAEGLCFDVSLDSKVFSCSLPAVGLHNVNNALLAVAVGWQCGLNVAEIVEGLGSYQPADMRMQVENCGGVTIIADCYNASPLSMRAALDTLALFSGRKIVLLADMLELGEHSQALHAQVGEQVAACGVDTVVTYGNKARFIAEAAERHDVPRVLRSSRHEETAGFLLDNLRGGDVLLIKGSRGMELENVLKAVRRGLSCGNNGERS